jgi:hypothetical protein
LLLLFNVCQNKNEVDDFRALKSLHLYIPRKFLKYLYGGHHTCINNTSSQTRHTLFIRDCRMLLSCATFVIHNTSLKSILEDDSIFSASIAHIRSCLGKGVGLLTHPQVPCVTQKWSKELDLRKWLETWCRSQLPTLKGVEGSCWKLRD